MLYVLMCLCVSSPHPGVKITGGYREITGEDFGVYIKRVVAGGLAAQDGTYLTLLELA